MRLVATRIPWITICSLIGAGIGYLLSGGQGGSQAMVPAMYGLGAGMLVGMAITMTVLIKARRRQRQRVESDGKPLEPVDTTDHRDDPDSPPPA